MSSATEESDNQSLRFVKPMSWDDVFGLWRKGEANLPHWIEHYRQEGFSSWDDWREHSLKNLKGKDLEWNLFEIENPLRIVPTFFAGPFRAWRAKYFHGAETVSFAEIAGNGDLREEKAVRELIADFPKETYLVGLRTERGIVVIEGMHRSVALTVAAEEKKAIESRIYIALAEFSGALPELGSIDSPT